MTKALREKRFVLESPAVDIRAIKLRPLTVVEAMHKQNEVRAISVTLRGTNQTLNTIRLINNKF